MKAQMHFLIKDDNSFQSIYEGSGMDFAEMLYRTAKSSEVFGSTILIAAARLLKDNGDTDLAGRLANVIPSYINTQHNGEESQE